MKNLRNSMVFYFDSSCYELMQFNGGIDVYDVDRKKFIGDMLGESLPDPNDHECCEYFKHVTLQQWLDENYL